MVLEGYKTYITAAALFLIGLAGYIDPSAAAFVAQQLGLDTQSVLVVCGIIMAILRYLTKTN